MTDEARAAKLLAEAAEHVRATALGLSAVLGPLAAARLLHDEAQRLLDEIDAGCILPTAGGGHA